MKYINKLENINIANIRKIYIDGIIKENEENKFPGFIVVLNSDEVIKHDISTAFRIRDCNEFLKSLHLLEEEIEFSSYQLYDVQVSICNKLLEIRRLMENITGQKYDDIGILSEKVHLCILDRLLAKHHLASKGWETAMQKRPLEEWVKEAIEYLKG